jgi:hypothetical protein
MSSNNCRKGIVNPFRITTFHEWSLCQKIWSTVVLISKELAHEKRLINKGNTSSNLAFLNSVGPPTLSSPANPSSFQRKNPRSEEESRKAGPRFPGTEEYRMASRLFLLLYTRLSARLTRLST